MNTTTTASIRQFCREIPHDKIKIKWHKIPMDLFLSFLTVDVVRSKEHLGSHNGWTLLTGENDLKISGGIINGVEYLDSLRYKKNLDNDYNDYINPFYMFDILNEKGKRFFLDHYADEIEVALNKAKKVLDTAQLKVKEAKEKEEEMSVFWKETMQA